MTTPRSPHLADDLTDYGAEKGGASARPSRRTAPARPTRGQLAFHDLELGLFIHFGLDTYTGQSSGDGKEPADKFNPTELDCDQWMRAAKAMGARYVVYTARHEGGFCTWPTGTHEYSVAHCSWRQGKGDVVREFVDACRRNGLKVGLYHTPSHDAHAALVCGMADRYDYTERYIQIQVEQVTELLTNYGPIDYLWFDHHTGGELYRRVDDAVRRLQPNCVIFGPDVWIVGGHSGIAEYPLWHAVDTADGTVYARPTTTGGEPWGQYYRVWEANCIFSGNWFWNGPGVVPLDEMIDLYYQSVGRGANFLPNFAPDRTGRMTDAVLERAKAFGDEIRRRLGTPVGETTRSGDTVELNLRGAKTIDHVVLMEDLRMGQTIAGYRIEALIDNRWTQIASGQTIGHKRIHRMEPVTATKVRFRCVESLTGRPRLRSLAVYNAGTGRRAGEVDNE